LRTFFRIILFSERYVNGSIKRRGVTRRACVACGREMRKTCNIMIYKPEQKIKLISLDISMWEDTIKVDMRDVHVIILSLLALTKQRLVAGPLATLRHESRSGVVITISHQILKYSALINNSAFSWTLYNHVICNSVVKNPNQRVSF
jgi:hypothetical protein